MKRREPLAKPNVADHRVVAERLLGHVAVRRELWHQHVPHRAVLRDAQRHVAVPVFLGVPDILGVLEVFEQIAGQRWAGHELRAAGGQTVSRGGPRALGGSETLGKVFRHHEGVTMCSVSILAAIGNTPLVRLRSLDRDLPCPVYAKCEHLNPGGSIKDRLALAIVDDAEARGRLRPGMTLIEATAGNTGVGLALVAAARGYELVCVMPEKMSLDKRRVLAALGARVIITPNAPPSNPDNFQNVARRLAAENDWFLTDQFENPVNIEIHRRTTGVEILRQVEGRIGAFVAGAGTGGTITGVAQRLRDKWPEVAIVLADPVGSSLAAWIETGGIGARWAVCRRGHRRERASGELEARVDRHGRDDRRRAELCNGASADPRRGAAGRW